MAGIAVTIKVVDRGWADIIRELRATGQSYVAVGVFGGQESDGTPMTLVAAANEYGVPGRIPARSFLRSTMDETQGELAELRNKLAQRVIDRKMTARQSLEFLGQWAQAKVQAKISSNIPPPNAPSTIQKKMRTAIGPSPGFVGTRTLIDTGQLRQSITYEVGDGEGPK